MSTQTSTLETLAAVQQRLATARAQLEQLLTDGSTPSDSGGEPSLVSPALTADHVVSALAVVREAIEAAVSFSNTTIGQRTEVSCGESTT